MHMHMHMRMHMHMHMRMRMHMHMISSGLVRCFVSQAPPTNRI